MTKAELTKRIKDGKANIKDMINFAIYCKDVCSMNTGDVSFLENDEANECFEGVRYLLGNDKEFCMKAWKYSKLKQSVYDITPCTSSLQKLCDEFVDTLKDGTDRLVDMLKELGFDVEGFLC